MVQRWPGCFIPSIPTKNFMHKNDKDETVKRERYLNDFVIKMTRLPHLYNS
jgi:sorting nexin-1/2/sorting nexin-4